MMRFSSRGTVPYGFLTGRRNRSASRLVLVAGMMCAVLLLAVASSLLSAQQVEFLKDATQKTVIFVVIILLAIFLNLLVDEMAGIQVSPIIVLGIKGVEYLIFALDLAWFGFYLLASTIQMIASVSVNLHGL